MVTGLVLVAATAAGPTTTPNAGWEATPTGWAAGDVTHVASVPLDAGVGAGLAIHDDLLVVTSWRGFSLYDITDPELPLPLSTTPLGVHFLNENPQTNGEILVMGDDLNTTLHIWDITDRRLPTEIGQFKSARGDHMWACVEDCAYAYGSRGTILDLSDPTSPKDVGDWVGEKGPRGWHSILEVAPGILFTGTEPTAYVLDTREDPAAPTVMAVADVETDSTKRPYLVIGPAPRSLPGYMAWPADATARFALMSMETPFSGACDERSGGLRTYDTLDWEETGEFVVTDEYRITENGEPSEGLAPANLWGCSAYGLDTPPGHADSGLVAVSWFEHGLRIIEVDDDGQITEVGGFLTHGGASAIPLWVDDELLYVVDLNRGLDIFRVGVSPPPQ